MEKMGQRGKLMIVCGLPGSGKTTRAKELQQKCGGIRFAPDEWMNALGFDLYDEVIRDKIEKLQWQLGQHLLTIGVTVTIEWGTWGRSERDALRLRARELGVVAELYYLTAPVDVLFDRLTRRGMENPPITREQLEQWARIFQPPTAEEKALFDKALTVDSSGTINPNSTEGLV
jgi:predicted kinase